MPRQEFVMTPGPTETSLRVLKALMQPATSPGDPEFVQACDATSELLRTVLDTKNNVVFFPGSGRVAIESAVTSIVEPGDRVLTFNNGVFGKWIGITVERAGGENVQHDSNWRRAVDPEDVRKRLRSEKNIKMVCLVHNETSTGVRNPAAEIGKIVKEHGVLFLLDTVSSAAGDFVRTDDWQVDLNCTGNYKCMNCPPGLAIVSVSNDAWAVMAKRKVRRSFSFDLYKYVEMWIPPERGGRLIWGYRRHVVEPVPQLTYALYEALQMLAEEGFANRYQKNALAGKAIRAAVRAIGLELYPLKDEFASNTLTAIVNPPSIANSAIVDTMRHDYGVLIAGALEEVAGKVLRIAHMSNTSDEMYVLYTVNAFENTLAKLGWKAPKGAALSAAAQVFASRGQ